MNQQKKAPQICYLLGAGASYHALPLVKEFPHDLKLFYEYILAFNNLYTRNEILDISSKLSNFKQIIEEVKDHHSIDTLAKKYWLKSKKGGRNEKNPDFRKYQHVKRIIACLLTWRRLRHSQLGIGTLEGNNPTAIELRLNSLRRQDPRYDAFFSAILTDNIKLPENIKIVSWNYDLQIEESFKFFGDNWNVVRAGHNLKMKYKTASEGAIIKLNGHSVLYNQKQFVKSDIYDVAMHHIFVSALKNEKDSNISCGVKFAWENTGYIQQNRTAASKLIKESNYVVIIGYSFPIFNREVDIQLFSQFNNDENRKIFIQAPEMEANWYKNQLESILTGLSQKAEIVKNLDQFYMPNEFWKPYEPVNYIF